MPCYFQCDSCKRENSSYTESHTRSLKITWHIYCNLPVLSLKVLDTVLLRSLHDLLDYISQYSIYAKVIFIVMTL